MEYNNDITIIPTIQEVTKEPNNNLNLPDGIINEDGVFFCKFCKVQIKEYPHTIHHANSREHEKQLEISHKGISQIKKSVYKCSFCKCLMHTLNRVEKHLGSEQHRNKVDSKNLDKKICVSMNKIKTSAGSFINVSVPSRPKAQMTRKTPNKKNHMNKLVQQSRPPESHEPQIKSRNIDFQSIQCYFPQTALPDCIESIAGESLLLCTICNYKMNNTLKTVEEHVQGSAHIKNCSGKKIILKIRETVFVCFICLTTICKPQSLQGHLSSESHQRKRNNSEVIQNNALCLAEMVTKLLKPIEKHERNRYNCTICDIRIKGDEVVALEHTIGHRHQTTLKALSSSVKSIQAVSSVIPQPVTSNQQVDISTKEPTATVKKYGLAKLYIDNRNLSKNLPDGIRVLNKKKLFCTICNYELSRGQSIDEHITTSDHMTKRPKVVQYIGNGFFRCKACKYRVMDKNLLEHLKSVHHSSNITVKLSRQETEKKRLNDLPDGIIRISNDNRFWCQICLTRIPGTLRFATAHVNQPIHKQKKKQKNKVKEKGKQRVKEESSSTPRLTKPISKNMIKLNNKMEGPNECGNTKFSCSFCDRKMDSVQQLHVHLTHHYWPRFVEDEPTKIIRNSIEIQDVSQNNKNQVSQGSTTEKQSPEDCDDLEIANQSEKSLKKSQSKNWRKRSCDIDIEDGLNLYEMNTQKKKNLQLGVLLTLITDRKSLYCLVCRKTIDNSTQTVYEHLCAISHMNHLQQMIEDHRTFKDYPGELSDLTLGYEYMEEVNDFSVKCHACGISLSNNVSSLNEHIKDFSHAERRAALTENAKTLFVALSSRMRYDYFSVKSYWCVPCKVQFTMEIDFRRHLSKNHHLKRIQRFKNSDQKLIFDYCAVCATLWFGFLRTFSYHSRCAMHNHYSRQSLYSVTELPILAERLLHSPKDKADKFVDEIDKLGFENAENEKKLIDDLENDCREIYPSCIAHPFGSRVTKLARKDSDLDIYLECSSKEYSVYEGQNSSVENVEECLTVVKGCLIKNPKVWLIDGEILNARIPIIKAVHEPTGIECDISFTNGLSVEGTKLIISYCDNFPNCRRMIIFIKNWMAHCELTDLKGIPSCAISWMVIAFLQIKGIVPSVAELILKKRQSRIIGGWETGVDFDFVVIDTDEPIEELLAGFFKFYSDFDYRNEVICPLLGRSMKKIDFELQEIRLYNQYLESIKDPEPFRIDSIMCLQDPFDLSCNVTKSVKKFVVYKLKSYCSLSAQIMEKY